MEFNGIEVVFLYLVLSGVSCFREGSLLQPIPKRPSPDVLVTHESPSTTLLNSKLDSIQPNLSQLSTDEPSTKKQKDVKETKSSSATLLSDAKGVAEVLTTDYPSTVSKIRTSNNKESTSVTPKITTSNKTTKTSSTTKQILDKSTKKFDGIKKTTPQDKIVPKVCINIFNAVIPCKHSKSSSRTTRDLSSSLNNNIGNSPKEVTKSWYVRTTRNLLSTLYSSQRDDLLKPLNDKSSPNSEDSTKATDQASNTNTRPGGILTPLKPGDDVSSTVENGGTSGDSSTSGSGRPIGLVAAFNSSSTSSDVTSNTKQPGPGPIQAVFVGESGSGNNGQSSSPAQPSSQHSNTHLLNPVQTTELKPNNNSKDPSSVTNPVIINNAGIGGFFSNNNAKSTTVKPAALKNNAGRTSMIVPSLLMGLMMLLIYK